MKIAVTADAHLRTGARHPERYHALEHAFDNTVAAGLDNLTIAAYLFYKDPQNYSDV